MRCLRIKEATEKGYKEAFEGDYINLAYPQSTTRRGRVGRGIANTITTIPFEGGVHYKYVKD